MDVGVIGVGSMGKNHARLYSELKSVNNLFVYDINQNEAHKVAYNYSATACGTLQSLLDHSEAISVCVPTQYHFEVVKRVFAEGKHVLIEKPLCSSYNEAVKLLWDYPAKVVVGVGHIERFNPVVAELCKIMKKPLYIEMKRHNPTSSRITGTSVVEDLMIHDIDILHYSFNKVPSEIHGVGNDDVCNVVMNCDGVPVMLSASRKASKKCRSIYIEEEDFTLEGNLMTQEVMVYRKPGKYHIDAERYVQENIIERVMVNKVEPLRVELSTFIECVKSRKPFPVTADNGMWNLKMCEDIRACCGGK